MAEEISNITGLVQSIIPQELTNGLGILINLGIFATIIFIAYIAFLIIKGFFSIKHAFRIKSIDENVKGINQKLDKMYKEYSHKKTHKK